MERWDSGAGDSGTGAWIRLNITYECVCVCVQLYTFIVYIERWGECGTGSRVRSHYTVRMCVCVSTNMHTYCTYRTVIYECVRVNKNIIYCIYRAVGLWRGRQRDGRVGAQHPILKYY